MQTIKTACTARPSNSPLSTAAIFLMSCLLRLTVTFLKTVPLKGSISHSSTGTNSRSSRVPPVPPELEVSGEEAEFLAWLLFSSPMVAERSWSDLAAWRWCGDLRGIRLGVSVNEMALLRGGLIWNKKK